MTWTLVHNSNKNTQDTFQIHIINKIYKAKESDFQVIKFDQDAKLVSRKIRLNWLLNTLSNCKMCDDLFSYQPLWKCLSVCETTHLGVQPMIILGSEHERTNDFFLDKKPIDPFHLSIKLHASPTPKSMMYLNTKGLHSN